MPDELLIRIVCSVVGKDNVGVTLLSVMRTCKTVSLSAQTCDTASVGREEAEERKQRRGGERGRARERGRGRERRKRERPREIEIEIKMV